MENYREDLNFEEKITEQLIVLSKKDIVINKLIELVSYFEKTKEDTCGFDIMPNDNEIDDILISKVNFTKDSIYKNQIFTEEHIFDLSKDLGKILFLREEFLKEICYLVCCYYGEGTYDNAELINEKIQKDLFSIKIDKNKTFLQNVYNNIVIKNSVMKFFTGTVFISHPDKEVKIIELDYDFLLDQVPSLIKMIYSGQNLKNKEIDIKKINYNLNSGDLSQLVEEDENYNESDIKNFISLMIDDLRKTNHGFCQSIISDLIFLGRINASI